MSVSEAAFSGMAADRHYREVAERPNRLTHRGGFGSSMTAEKINDMMLA